MYLLYNTTHGYRTPCQDTTASITKPLATNVHTNTKPPTNPNTATGTHENDATMQCREFVEKKELGGANTQKGT